MIRYGVLLTLLQLLIMPMYVRRLQSFAYKSEKEDSVSAISFKRLKSVQTERLIWKVIKQCKKDSEQKHEVHKYKIDATFSRDSLPPYVVYCILYTDNANIGLKDVKIKSFDYSGIYKLSLQDSAFIINYLDLFATLSPVYAHKPNVSLRFVGMGIDMEPLSPLTDFDKTYKFYNVGAYKISDGSGREIFRIAFVRNKKRLLKNFDKKYEPEQITGTAYFDTKTYHIKRFEGKAYLPTLQYDSYLNYEIDYDDYSEMPILKQTKINWLRGGTQITASVQRIDE